MTIYTSAVLAAIQSRNLWTLAYTAGKPSRAQPKPQLTIPERTKITSQNSLTGLSLLYANECVCISTYLKWSRRMYLRTG